MTVVARPRVAVLSTGDELADCATPTLPPGKVRDRWIVGPLRKAHP